VGDLTKIGTEDMSEEEKTSLQDFVKNGCPGLLKTTESNIFSWFELYMAGKTYSEISTLTHSKRDLILYMSNKSGWYEKRMTYYEDLVYNMTKKMSQVKLDSMNTVSTAITALGRYYGDKFNKYLSSKDSKIIEDIDTKMLSQYYKSMEALEKIMGNAGKKPGESTPLVNVNMNGGTIERTGENSVEITDESASSILEALVKYKKSQNKE